MAEPYIGEIRLMSFAYAPQGWAACDGALLSAASNGALYSLIGVQYGGTAPTTFNLPDLRGRIPVCVGGTYTMGQSGGEETHALTAAEMPVHTHTVTASSAAATTASPTGTIWATGTKTAYTSAPNMPMSSAAIGATGTSAGHNNLPPYQPLFFCIAIAGTYPTRP